MCRLLNNNMICHVSYTYVATEMRLAVPFVSIAIANGTFNDTFTILLGFESPAKARQEIFALSHFLI